MNQPSPLVQGLKPRLKPDDIIARQISVPRNVVPSGYDFITVFADVSLKCLWFSVVAFNKKSFKAHVLNSGVWPNQNKSYVTKGLDGKHAISLKPVKMIKQIRGASCSNLKGTTRFVGNTKKTEEEGELLYSLEPIFLQE